jgi:protein-disulfide isomerase
MKRTLPFLIILAVLGVALGAGWYLTRPAVHSNGTANASSPANTVASSATPAPKMPSSANPGAQPPHALGPEDAPVTLEEFGDFECPPCGLLHPVLKTMEKEFGSRVRVIFREFPLVPTHSHALVAARSAEAAGLQGKFWEMHDLLFENQKIWHEQFDARPTFEGYAQKLGLDMERFRSDVSSQVVEQRIFLDGKRAHDVGVKGTPTVFLNGRELPFESLAPEKLRERINAELANPVK